MEEFPSYSTLLQSINDADAAVAATGDLSSTSPAIIRLRAAYNAFLADFPLCHGYWKRFADFEMVVVDPTTSDTPKHSRADAIYERALKLGKHCVDLWELYGQHATEHWSRPEDVRALFERGAAYVGSDHAGDVFWDRYLAFEATQAGDDHSRVAALYRRILQLPIKSLDAVWLRFQQLSVERSCAELITSKEEASLHQQLGMPASTPASEDDGARKLRLLPLIEAHFRKAQQAHAERLQWEGGIKRRHFHLQPVPAAQYSHIHAYLDWEEGRVPEDVPRILLTYERVLVPLCMDASMWRRYIKCLERRGMITEAREAFSRASGHFLRRRCQFVLEHAEFEEYHDSFDAARSLCLAAASLRPPYLEAVLAQANLERRLGEAAKMRSAYESGSKLLDGDSLAYLVRHAAHYESMCQKRVAPEAKDLSWATSLIESALEKEPASEVLWDVRLTHEIDNMEFHYCDPGSIIRAADDDGLERVYALFERAIVAMGSGRSHGAGGEEMHITLLRRYAQVARDYSEDVHKIRELTERLEEASESDPDAPKRRKLDTTNGNGAASAAGGAAQPASGAAGAAASYPPAYPQQTADYSAYYAAQQQYYQQQPPGQPGYPGYPPPQQSYGSWGGY